MYGNDMENKTKMQSLMDLMSKMKELQVEGLHGEDEDSEESPDGVALEMHEVHAEPLSSEDVEKLEEATHTDLDKDNEEGEPQEHKDAVLGESSEDHDLSPMELHPELMKLLQEHLSRK